MAGRPAPPAGTGGRRTILGGIPAWVGFCAVLLPLVPVYYALPSHRLVQVGLYLAIGAGSVAALAHGALRRSRARPVFALLALATGLFVAGDFAGYAYYPLIADRFVFPGLADGLYLAGYPFVGAAVFLIGRRKLAGDLGGYLDASIVIVAVGLPWWEFLIDPYLHGHGLTPAGRAVAMAYPSLALLLFALASRLLAVRSGSASFLFICGALAATLLADAAYCAVSLAGDYAPGSWVEFGWLLAYVLWGAAVLHPSADTLLRPPPQRKGSTSVLHVVALAAVLFGLPAWLALDDLGVRGHPDLVLTLAGALALLGLVIARIGLLVRRSSRSVRRSERLARQIELLLDSAGQAIVAVDRDGRITLANPVAGEFLGYTKPELVGRRLHDVVHHSRPNGSSYPAADCPACFASSGGRRGVEVFFRRDGTSFPIEYTATPVVEEGEVVGLVLVFDDIGERLRVEAALRASEERFRAMFESSAVGIVATGPGGLVLAANPAFQAMTGCSEAELRGRTLEDLADPADADLLGEAAAALVAGEPSRAIELGFRRTDGELLSTRMTLAAIRGGEGPQRLIGVVEDTTERKRLEQALLQSQKLEAVGQLAGGIAHDFNNLLTVISGYAAFALSRSGDDSRLRKSIEEIGGAAERAASLTGQLLAFSRRQVLQPKLLDLNEIVRGAEGLLRRLLGADVHVVAELDPSLALVRADPAQLVQALVNLALNARDAMPDGGTLTLRTSPAEVDGQDYALLEVGDTGSGMDEATQARVFEPFFTTKEVGDGAGLGLSTVDGILRQSGGFVTVRSAPGEGATFAAHLPAVDRAAASVDRADAPALGGRERILLVEDEAAVRELVLTMLEEQGYDVDSADGPEAALALLSGGDPYDLLVTDVVMPRLNGRELGDRALAAQPGIGILYISGYTGHAIVESVALEPGRGFLQKPFDARALAVKVREVLDVDGRPVPRLDGPAGRHPEGAFAHDRRSPS